MNRKIGIFVRSDCMDSTAIPQSLNAETGVEKTKILIEKDADVEWQINHIKGRILEEYESFYLAEVPTTGVEKLTRYTIVSSMPETIALNWAEFKIQNPPELPSNLALIDVSGYDYYIIQMKAIVKQAWLSTLRENGCTVYDFLPHNVFVVKIPSQNLATVRSIDFVNEIVLYQPAYKLSYLLKELHAETTDIWIELYPDVEWKHVVNNLLISSAEDVVVHRESNGRVAALISAKVTPGLFRVLLK